MSRILEKALARLAAAPPKSFVRERGLLVAQLQKAGEAEAAAQVKARRAPTLPVWIVNRLATGEPRAVDALIATADRVRAAQLGHRSEAGGLAKAMAEHREALNRLLDRGRSLLEELGAANPHQTLLRVQRTLNASVVDSATRAALRRGHIEAELAAPGFDVFGGARPVASRKKREDEDEPRHPAKPASTAGTQARAKAKERLDRRETARAQRRERVESLQAAVAEAEGKVAASHQRASAGKAQLAKLLEDVRQAKQELKEQDTEARRLAQALSRARSELRAASRRR